MLTKFRSIALAVAVRLTRLLPWPLQAIYSRTGAGLRLFKLSYLSRSSRNYIEIDNGEFSLSSRYRQFDTDEPRVLDSVTMPIGMWKLTGARIFSNPKFPMVQTSSRLTFLPRSEPGPYHHYAQNAWNPGFHVLRENDRSVVAKIPMRRVDVSPCVYVGTRAPRNWSHWLINFLPGVMVAADYFSGSPPGPLIVGPGFSDGPARSALFSYFWGDSQTTVCEDEEFIGAKIAYWFEQPFSDSPRPKSRENLLPKSANWRTMTKFRDRLLEFSVGNASDRDWPDKVFLAREPTFSRPYNGREVEAVAVESGYEIVFLNRLSIADQIATVNHARRLVGPHGSAFANTIVAGGEQNYWSLETESAK